MDTVRQIELMIGAVEDYQNKLMPLQNLIWRIEGILAVLEEDSLSDGLSDAVFALEDVNAHLDMPNYDFESKGRPLVDGAISDILAKVAAHLSRFD